MSTVMSFGLGHNTPGVACIMNICIVYTKKMWLAVETNTCTIYRHV